MRDSQNDSECTNASVMRSIVLDHERTNGAFVEVRLLCV